MSGRLIGLCAAVAMALAGCSDLPYDEAYPEAELSNYSQDNYAVIEDQKIDVAETNEGYLYFAQSQQTQYTLDSGDRLRIDVFGQENLSRTYSVDGGGYVSLPLIGAVRARGHTTFALARIIASKLSEDYVRDPKVTVEISTYRPFFILGEVRAPGKFSFENGMTVRTAVAIAGGYTPRASEEMANVTRVVNGERMTMEVPYSFPVQPGDTIYVPERFL